VGAPTALTVATTTVDRPIIGKTTGTTGIGEAPLASVPAPTAVTAAIPTAIALERPRSARSTPQSEALPQFAGEISSSTTRPIFAVDFGAERPTNLDKATAPAAPPSSATTRPLAIAAASSTGAGVPVSPSGGTASTASRVPDAPLSPVAPQVQGPTPTPAITRVAPMKPESAKAPSDASDAAAFARATRLATPDAVRPPPGAAETITMSPAARTASTIAPNATLAAPAPTRALAPSTPSAGPDVSLAAITPDGPLGPGSIAAGDSPFPRSAPQRQANVQKRGGTDASEKAVDAGLAYLSKMQQYDGRWTYILDDQESTPRPPHPHDTACTGLALLSFLTRDHVPGKEGPYRATVVRGLDFLIGVQGDDGDLRAAAELRGPGSNRGNMYDHAIATLALAEAAIMSHDRRYTEAALAGARFIIAAQDPHSGGWRYSPGEYGDSSVFGWQIMALHAAEQLGLEIPEQTRRNAARYLQMCTQGQEHRVLAGYQPGNSPTAAMTAELLYARMLLGQELDKQDLAAAAEFISRQGNQGTPDLYCWYYGSLCMLQVQGDAWNRWNARTRDTLIRMQRHGENDPLAGSWDANIRWGAQGGRVFTTSLAVLTLEVYYRYLPLRPEAK
jgi:hypothetical protein